MTYPPPAPAFDGAITMSGNCGLCGDPSCMDRTVRTRPQAAAILRGRGWTLTAEHGWICPRCFGRMGSDAASLTINERGAGL